MIRFIPYNFNMILKKESRIIGKIKGNLLDNNYYYLYGLRIAEDYRGKNYGLELISNYEKLVLNNCNIKGFKLKCPNFDKKYKLVDYYSKIGYEIDQSTNMFYDDISIIPMIKKHQKI
mgnify:FL=1